MFKDEISLGRNLNVRTAHGPGDPARPYNENCEYPSAPRISHQSPFLGTCRGAPWPWVVSGIQRKTAASRASRGQAQHDLAFAHDGCHEVGPIQEGDGNPALRLEMKLAPLVGSEAKHRVPDEFQARIHRTGWLRDTDG